MKYSWHIKIIMVEKFSHIFIHTTCFMEQTFDKLHNQWFSVLTHSIIVARVCLEPSLVENFRLKRYNQDCTMRLPIGCVSLAQLA